MRVITGIARGRRLVTVPGKDIVRPTSEKVKEALFSAIQFDIEGRRILDGFAGCGQLGIEALSRGAESAVFVDCSDASINVIKQNLKATACEENARVIKSTLEAFAARSNDTFDIAFLDPPYKAEILLSALEAIQPLMSDFGKIFCEHPKEVELPSKVNDFSAYKVYVFGKTKITAYKKDVAENE